MDGWHQFLYVDHRYASCVWAKMPLEVVAAEVREWDLRLKMADSAEEIY